LDLDLVFRPSLSSPIPRCRFSGRGVLSFAVPIR
jgi:hypothetical protein